jgi:hypothetical protein
MVQAVVHTIQLPSYLLPAVPSLNYLTTNLANIRSFLFLPRKNPCNAKVSAFLPSRHTAWCNVFAVVTFGSRSLTRHEIPNRVLRDYNRLKDVRIRRLGSPTAGRGGGTVEKDLPLLVGTIHPKDRLVRLLDARP